MLPSASSAWNSRLCVPCVYLTSKPEIPAPNLKWDSESLYEYDLEGSILFLFLKPDVFVYLGEDYPSVFGVYDDTAESIPDNFDFRKSGQRII